MAKTLYLRRRSGEGRHQTPKRRHLRRRRGGALVNWALANGVVALSVLAIVVYGLLNGGFGPTALAVALGLSYVLVFGELLFNSRVAAPRVRDGYAPNETLLVPSHSPRGAIGMAVAAERTSADSTLNRPTGRGVSCTWVSPTEW